MRFQMSGVVFRLFDGDMSLRGVCGALLSFLLLPVWHGCVHFFLDKQVLELGKLY